MNPNIVKAVPNALTLLLGTLLVYNYFEPFADLDYTWQIRTGDLILKTGDLRPKEQFSYTIAGKDLPDFEWLYEVTLALIWRGFGYGGLKLLKTVLVATPLVLLGWRLGREGMRWYGIALALLIAIFIVNPLWNLRPMYCTVIGQLLVSSWLHEHCHGKRSLPWYLPLVMFVWANAHPGVILGQALLVGAIVWEWLNRLVRFHPALDIRGCWQLTIVGGIGLGATFLSPAPVERLIYPFRADVHHSVQRIFVEMQPLRSMLTVNYPGVWAAYVLTGAVALTWVVRFRRYRFWEIGYLFGLTGLANLAIRSLQDMVFGYLNLGFPQISLALRDYVLRRRSKRNWLFRFDRLARHTLETHWFGLQPAWLLAIFGVLAVISLIPPIGRGMPKHEAHDWPTRALDWMEKHGIEGRIFGPPDYGSYVCWRLGDRARCYVDTRGFYFPGELIEDSHYLPQLTSEWERRLERVFEYGTDYFLLETESARGEMWKALKPFVPDPVYEDDETVLVTAEQVRRGMEKFKANQ